MQEAPNQDLDLVSEPPPSAAPPVAPTAQARRLRIAVVTETYPPELNGVARTLCRAVAYLRDRGHAVEVIRPRQTADRDTRRTDQLLIQGVPLPMYRAIQLGLPAGGLLRRRWQRMRPDVVHIATEGPLGWSALRTARACGVPVTTDYRTDFPRYSSHYGLGWLEQPIDAYLRAFHNRSAATFVSTRALRRDLSGRGYRNLLTVGRGVDTELFSPGHRSNELRAQWGVSERDVAVLYVGRLAAEKNLQLAVRSFEEISKHVPTARMIWVGDGPLAKRLAREHPGHIHAGAADGEVLARHYASADLFLFPSLTETFGNVTLEALASGLALVAFDYGAAAEHAQNWVSARLVPFGDDREYTRAAVQLARAPAALARIREAAAHSVAHLTWPSILSTFEEHLAACARHTLPADAPLH